MTSSDDVFQALISAATSDPGKPPGLAVEPFPVLSVENVDLPYMGITLVEGDRPVGDDSSDKTTIRTCKIQVEIWARGDQPLSATLPFREWILGLIFQDETLGGKATSCDFQGFEATSGALDGWVGLCVLEFVFTYFWRPE